MTRILHIDSSLFSADGASSQLAGEYVDGLRARGGELQVTHLDLGRNPLPHLDAERIGAIGIAETSRSESQHAIASQADALIEDLRNADLLVLGAPMYNFSIPSQLKSWFDHVARAGTTFRYTENGPEGLLKNKRAVVFTTRGGIHKDGTSDSVTPLVRTFLNFLGIESVEFVYAEGLNLGEAPRQDAMAAARHRIAQLLRQEDLAA